ncbi:MAG: nucleotide pyrophosphohydrolase [Candidatus Wallbacteria bacterium]|nr:nucleotide pyrophosphohydrolase [Candidatus Wallbacteria bacterium]
MRNFNNEREWSQFHSPKNLAMALSVECAELTEHFQWLTEEQSRNLPQDMIEPIKDEIGDILIYLLNISDKLGVDPLAAAHAKIEKNRVKYPVEKARGLSKKYTEL